MSEIKKCVERPVTIKITQSELSVLLMVLAQEHADLFSYYKKHPEAGAEDVVHQVRNLFKAVLLKGFNKTERFFLAVKYPSLRDLILSSLSKRQKEEFISLEPQIAKAWNEAQEAYKKQFNKDN